MKPIFLNLHRFPALSVKSIRTVCIRYPVEYLLFVYSFVVCVIAYHDGMGPSDRPLDTTLMAPAFCMGAYIINRLFQHGSPRVAYYLVLPAFLIFVWTVSSCYELLGVIYYTTTCIVLPVGVLLCHRRLNDRSFCEVGIGVLVACIVAFIIGVLISILSGAILYSARFIFAIDLHLINDIFAYWEMAVWLLITPAALLNMLDGVKAYRIDDLDGLQTIFNRILTPAVCIYLAILYAYSLKIAAVWQLPKGGIANLVFGFMVFAILMQALSQFIPHSRTRTLYRWMSIGVLPALLLFWCSAWRRVTEYGYTPWRVYMVLCGGLITFQALLFLTRYTKRYALFGSVLIVSFLAMAVIPGWRAEAISLRSQTARVRKAAADLGLLQTKDGALTLDKLRHVPAQKEKEVSMLYQSLKYISLNDSAAFARFKLPPEGMAAVESAIPRSMYATVLQTDDPDSDITGGGRMELLPDNTRSLDVSEYRAFYPVDMTAKDLNDSLFTFSVAGRELQFTRQELQALTEQHLSPENRNPEMGNGLWRVAPSVLTLNKGDSLILFKDIIRNGDSYTVRVMGVFTK